MSTTTAIAAEADSILVASLGAYCIHWVTFPGHGIETEFYWCEKVLTCHKPQLAAASQSWDRRILGGLPPDHQVKRVAILTAPHS